MRLFISHGFDKASPAELQYLDSFEHSLSQAGRDSGAQHDILLDRVRLDAGVDWEWALHDWLAECEGAVLLLSKRALGRPWVLKEATILSYRRQTDRQFLLLPVLLPDVTPADLAAHAGFSALRLDAIQAFTSASTAADVAQFVQGKAVNWPAPPSTPLDRLQHVLENWISQVSATALDDVCHQWLGQPVAWQADADRARQRARLMARVIARGHTGTSVTLAAMTKALTAAALPREHTRRVLDLAASLWVDAEVAFRLRGVMASRSERCVAAALNSSHREFGVRMAIWRALLPDLVADIYFVAAGQSDDRLGELSAAICREFMEGNKDDVDDEEDARDMLQARQEPAFFVLPPPAPDAALLSDLQAEFPSAVFIAHTGRDLPPDLGEHLVPLWPGLLQDLERRYKADYVTAKKGLS